MEEIKLYIINLDIGFSHKHHLLKVINESQKEKALKYKNDKDQMRSLLSSYLKNLISKEEILYKEKGKPYFANGPFFNISHSGKYVILAISNKEVGVDIEENVPKDMTMLLKMFNEGLQKIRDNGKYDEIIAEYEYDAVKYGNMDRHSKTGEVIKKEDYNGEYGTMDTPDKGVSFTPVNEEAQVTLPAAAEKQETDNTQP